MQAIAEYAWSLLSAQLKHLLRWQIRNRSSQKVCMQWIASVIDGEFFQAILLMRPEKNYRKICRFLNYGSTVPDPVFNSTLYMEFNSKTVCPTDHTKNITSKINFICSRDRIGDRIGKPVLFTDSDCMYTFNWETTLACNNRTTCVVHDPNTGFKWASSVYAYAILRAPGTLVWKFVSFTLQFFLHRYDFRSLSTDKKTYEVKHGDEVYELGICSSPEKCLNNSGACRIKGEQSESMGTLSELQLDEIPFLLYENGAKCEGDRRYTTIIQFVCPPADESKGAETNSDNGIPKVIEDKNCTLVIQFPTKAACQNTVSWGDIFSTKLFSVE